MSDEKSIKIKVIEQKIAGEFWWISALVDSLLPTPLYWVGESSGMWQARELPDYDKHSDPWNEQLDMSLWSVTVTGDATATTIRITAPGDQEQAWVERLKQIDDLAAFARTRHKRAQKMTAEDVISRYYLIKRGGGKMTIKQLSERYGFNENYLYQVKAAYDKSGKSPETTQGWVRQAYKVSGKP
jgi:hypothetical protein